MVSHLFCTVTKTGDSLPGPTAATSHPPSRCGDSPVRATAWTFLRLALGPFRQVSREVAVLSETENLGEERCRACPGFQHENSTSVNSHGWCPSSQTSVDKPPTTPSQSTPQHSQCTSPVPLLPGLALPVGSSVLLACLGTPAPSPESSCAVFTRQPGRRLSLVTTHQVISPPRGLPKKKGLLTLQPRCSELLSLTEPLFSPSLS